MSKKHLPVYVPIGLAAVFLVGVALVAVMLVKSCREDDVAYWGPMQEATDGTFYKGLPLGGLALSAYLNEEGVPDRNDRILRAYTEGRLAVSPRVYEQGPKDVRRFAQVVSIPFSEKEITPLLPASCDVHTERCELILGEESYTDPLLSVRLIPDIVGIGGYVPVKFLDSDTVLLEEGGEDGPCSGSGYMVVDFASALSKRSLYRSYCYGRHPLQSQDARWTGDEFADLRFSVGGKDVIEIGVRNQNPGEDILEAKAVIIDFVQGEKILRTLRNVVPPQGSKATHTFSPFDWIRADVDAYFANPSELRVLIGDSVYTFPVPADTGAPQADAEVGN